MKAQKFIALSRCLSRTPTTAEFHYRGVFQGIVVEGITVTNPKKLPLIVGADYMLKLKINGEIVEGEALKTLLINAKDLNSIKAAFNKESA